MRVSALFRYPVKSMQGERLDSAEVGTLTVGDDVRVVADAAAPSVTG